GAVRSSASCSRRYFSHPESRGTSHPTRRSAPQAAATMRLQRPAQVRKGRRSPAPQSSSSFPSNLVFGLPDVSNPRHGLAETVDELIGLEVLNAAEHDDLRVDTAFLQFGNPLFGWTDGLNLIVARVNREYGDAPG